ncbi:MAG: glycosyltransferase [Roseburia sp.]|nr:glycosyltransferase [Roseburia sp.]
MKKPELSVIVPIYNSEEYLTECIDSIMGQKFCNMEMILIDDGSTDGSGKLCDRYAKNDPRVRVIHRENGGLPNARKVGAREARAAYLTYVDSDDRIETDMYENLMSRIKQCDLEVDMVTSGLIFEKPGSARNVSDSLPCGVYGRESIADTITPNMMRSYITGEYGVVNSAVAKIYRTELLRKVIYHIDNSITYGEDEALVYSLIPQCGGMIITDECYYHYRLHEGSMNHTFDRNSFDRIFRLKEYFYATFSKLGIWEQQRPFVNFSIHSSLVSAAKSLYDIDMQAYVAPYELLPRGSRVIIYGAGKVGKNYYNELTSGRYAEVIAWVDRDYEAYVKAGYPVCSPEEIPGLQYDLICIAIEDGDTAAKIKEGICAKGISEERIIWRPPVFLRV